MAEVVFGTISVSSNGKAFAYKASAAYRQDGLLIAGLNSYVYETEQHHYGFVGGRQLAKLIAPRWSAC